MHILRLIRQLPRRFFALGAFGALGLALLIPATALAAPDTTTHCAATDLKCIIAYGDQLISNRQTSLTNLTTKVTQHLNAGHITTDQASVIQADVTTNQHGLNTLKAKLDAETSATAARTDVVNIFVQFRIYAVVLPRDYRRLYLDVEINVRERMLDGEPKIQAAISKAPASEQPQLNSLFSDYQKQLAAAEVQIDVAQQDLPALTPENFNVNRASYLATRAGLDIAEHAAHLDLKQAAQDLHQMTKILK